MSFQRDPYRVESPDEIPHGLSQLGGVTGPSVFEPNPSQRPSQRHESTTVHRHPAHEPKDKDHKRSDLRIREDVWERLLYADLDTNELNVDVEDGIVTLTGTVEDRRTKRLLEEISAHTAGVSGVDNQICVEKLPSSQMNLGTPYYSLASSGTDPSASV